MRWPSALPALLFTVALSAGVCGVSPVAANAQQATGAGATVGPDKAVAPGQAPAAAPSSTEKAKDIWDIIEAVSGVISAVLVAGIGFYATRVYNRRQEEAEQRRKDQEILVAQIQTVEKFIPHLSSSDEKIKKVALVAMSTLGVRNLAVELAQAFGGTGASSALTTIAATADVSTAARAQDALAELYRYVRRRVVAIYDGDRFRASGLVVSQSGWIVTAARAIRDIEPGRLTVRRTDPEGRPDRSAFDATVLRMKDNDRLALLAIHASHTVVFLTLSPATPKQGDHVTAVFAGADREARPQVGTVVGPRVEGATDGRQAEMMLVQLDANPDAIGGPVIDGEGRLLGLVDSVAGKVAKLIPAAEVFRLTGLSSKQV